MKEVFAYGRVSSKGQNIECQREMFKREGVDGTNVFNDWASGVSFDRVAYNLLKGRLRPGDLLIIESLDRFGRDWHSILREWREIHHEMGVDIKVLDCPMLNTQDNMQMADLLLMLLAYFAEMERKKIKERQRQGIATAQSHGVKFGRPKINTPPNFDEVCNKWHSGLITAVEAQRILGLKKDTFYRMVKANEKGEQ